MATPDDELIRECAQRLFARVVCANPEVAFDAHRALLSLAAKAPAIVGSLIDRRLFVSSQYWTRWCACHVGLKCGDGYFSPQATEKVIEEFITISSERPRLFADVGEGDIRAQIATSYTELVLKSGSDERAAALESLFSRCRTGIGTEFKILSLLRQYGQGAIACRLEAIRLEIFGGHPTFDDDRQTLKADRTILNCLARVCGATSSSAVAPRHLPTLGRLLAGFDWMDAPAYSWNRLGTIGRAFQRAAPHGHLPRNPDQDVHVARIPNGGAAIVASYDLDGGSAELLLQAGLESASVPSISRELRGRRLEVSQQYSEA
jgi:hypothetical protein